MMEIDIGLIFSYDLSIDANWEASLRTICGLWRTIGVCEGGRH